MLEWSSFRHTLHWLSAYRSYVIAGGLSGLCALVATSEVSGVVLPVVSFISVYVILVFVFLLCIVFVLPLRGSFFALYLFISSSVVFIYLLYSIGDVFYFSALVISYLFGTYDFH